ncbi:MAG: hypothetical protein ACE5GB_10970, partial [Acidimicrobiales bacterium]
MSTLDDIPKPASEHTAAANAHQAAVLSLDHPGVPGDFARATRGLIASIVDGRIEADGRVIWDVARHDFVRDHEGSPPSVHPGLWRQGRLNCIHGLFEIADGVWQARGYDISNITVLAGDEGAGRFIDAGGEPPPLNTDDNAFIEFSAPRTIYVDDQG